MPARVIEVLHQGTVDLGGGSAQPYQRLLLRVEGGSLAGQEIEVEEGTINLISQERLFHSGDRVYLERAVGPQGDRFYISDFVRTSPLILIVALFMGLVVLVGRGKGLRALGGTLFSLAVIFAFVLPQIIAGRDPVAVVGGTHLKYTDGALLDQLMEALRQFGPPALYLNHCTGHQAYDALAKAFGERVARCPAGTVLEF